MVGAKGFGDYNRFTVKFPFIWCSLKNSFSQLFCEFWVDNFWNGCKFRQIRFFKLVSFSTYENLLANFYFVSQKTNETAETDTHALNTKHFWSHCFSHHHRKSPATRRFYGKIISCISNPPFSKFFFDLEIFKKNLYVIKFYLLHPQMSLGKFLSLFVWGKCLEFFWNSII